MTKKLRNAHCFCWINPCISTTFFVHFIVWLLAFNLLFYSLLKAMYTLQYSADSTILWHVRFLRLMSTTQLRTIIGCWVSHTFYFPCSASAWDVCKSEEKTNYFVFTGVVYKIRKHERLVIVFIIDSFYFLMLLLRNWYWQ